MKNIYQDDFSGDNAQNTQNIYSSSSDSNQNSAPSPAPSRPVRPARQAPPPIKKAVIPGRQPQPEVQPQPFPQPGFYPQPVFIQQDPSQPYPVYYAPIPAPPYPPAQQPAPQGSPSQNQRNDGGSNEAGTRVLFQSDDFNLRDEPDEDERPASSPATSYRGFEVSEITLPSGKRAPAPSHRESFDVDEMEIGTYEFNIMTAGQSATARSVLTPDEESRRRELSEENYLDEIFEEDDEQEEEEDTAEEAEQETPAAPESKKKSKKALPTGEIVRRAVLAVSILAIIIASASLINEYRLHRENKKLMSDLSDMIITQTSTVEPTEAPDSSGDKKPGSVPTTLPIIERPLSIEEQWEALRNENPDVAFPANMQLKYAKLYAQNTDFVGYLKAEGSELDSPVVQGEDDEEYVEKNFNGEYTKYACPFVTHTNTIETLDSNTVIFGHHMRDGSIFGTLDQYRTLEGYKKAPVISFDTIYQDYDFKVIATMITNINPKDDNDYVFTYYWTNLNNELNHTAYLNQLSQRSLYDTGVDVKPTDKLLTLSTCCKDFEDARLVVVARLVRPGESTEVDTSLAVENENPRFPQAYYDEKGIKNPFAEAYQWQIS